MRKIAQRYLAINFLPPFLVSITFWVAFLITFQFFRLIGVIINKDVEGGVILDIIVSIAVTFLPIAVPLSIFFAMIFSLNKLSEDSEIIAMRSFGMTKWKLFKPYFIIGLFISASIFALNAQIIPDAKRNLKNTVIQLTSKGLLGEIRPGQFFTDIGGYILFTESVSGKDGTKLHNLFIHAQKNKNEDEKVIFAKDGELKKKQKDTLQLPEVRLRLYNGTIYQGKKGSDSVEKIVFNEFDFPLFSGGLSDNTTFRSDMMNTGQLLDRMYSNYIEDEMKKYGAPGSHGYNSRIKGVKKTHQSFFIEFWTRMNGPIQCMLFLFLGFCFGIKKGRGATKYGSFKTIGSILLYYILFFGLMSLAKKSIIPAFLVAFIPSLTMGLIGYRAYKKLDWNS